jgi:hypothetical protein
LVTALRSEDGELVSSWPKRQKAAFRVAGPPTCIQNLHWKDKQNSIGWSIHLQGAQLLVGRERSKVDAAEEQAAPSLFVLIENGIARAVGSYSCVKLIISLLRLAQVEILF